MTTGREQKKQQRKPYENDRIERVVNIRRLNENGNDDDQKCTQTIFVKASKIELNENCARVRARTYSLTSHFMLVVRNEKRMKAIDLLLSSRSCAFRPHGAYVRLFVRNC